MREFTARLGFISLSTSSFYGPVNFSGSSLVGIGTGSVLFTNASGSVTGSSNLVWNNANANLGIGSSPRYTDTSAEIYGQTGRVSTLFIKAATSGVSYPVAIAADSSGRGFVIGQSALNPTNFATPGFQLNVTSSGGSMVAYTNIGTGTEGVLYLQPGGGRVVIGSNIDNGYRLDVNGSGAASGSLRVSGSAYFVNNVGIGTATPNSPLHVAGNTYVGSALHVESGIYFNEGGGAFSRRTIWLDVGTNNVYFRLPDNKGSFVYQDWNTSSTLFLLNGSGSAYIKRSLIINKAANTGYTFEIDSTGLPSGSFLISGSSTQPTVVGNSLTSVNIIPTMVFTTASQTQTAFKVMPTFSGSSAFTSSQSNIIADFGATSVGSQLIVTDVTSGSIYMVNDVSGIPIAEATSDWNFLLYDYPYTVFKKTGSMIELGVPNQTSSFTLFKSDLIVNEGLGFYQRTSQVSGSTNGAVTSSLYNIQFTNTSASVYINAIVTGYDTGSRDTIAGDIKATIRYRSGVASIVGIDQSFVNSDNSVVGFDIIAGGTSGSLVAFGTGSRVYQWGATITTQVI